MLFVTSKIRIKSPFKLTLFLEKISLNTRAKLSFVRNKQNCIVAREKGSIYFQKYNLLPDVNSRDALQLCRYVLKIRTMIFTEYLFTEKKKKKKKRLKVVFLPIVNNFQRLRSMAKHDIPRRGKKPIPGRNSVTRSEFPCPPGEISFSFTGTSSFD